MSTIDKPLVSIVIPVYNTKEEYLMACFESIRLQTNDNNEVIVVDDGSNDETARFIDNYTLGLKKWSVIHKKNSGLNMARKAGYDSSKGQYVGFVDSDDVVSYKYIEKLLNTCLEQEVDMAVSEMLEFKDGQEPAPWGNPYDDLKLIERDNSVLVKDQLIKDGSRFTKHRTYEGLVWGKLYKRALLEKIDWNFSNYKITEDEFFSIQAHIHTKGLAYVYEQLYFYRTTQSNSLGTKVTYNAYNGKEIPYIQIAREVYEKFELLFEQNDFVYDRSDLVTFYVKILLDRTEKLLKSGDIDNLNKEEYKKQQRSMLPIVMSSSLNSEWKFLVQLVYENQKIAMYAFDVLSSKRNVNEELKRRVNQSSNIKLDKIEYGIKGSMYQLASALIRKVKN